MPRTAPAGAGSPLRSGQRLVGMGHEGTAGRLVRPSLALLPLVSAWSTALAQVGGGAREVPRDGGVYRRPLGNDPSTLDPAAIRDTYSLAVVQQLFDGLVGFDQTLSITPAL